MDMDMDASNGTADPRCSPEPPLAADIIAQFDTLWTILYSGLTLMAFLSLLIYVEECVYFYWKVPHPKKTSYVWVNGAAPVIAVMSCLALWIPRATMFTDVISGSFFAIVVYHFQVMMIEECGGDDAFLRRFGKNRFRISTPPCCCCCLCLPNVGITRRTLVLLKLGSYQFALLKTVFSILSIVLWTNGIYDPEDVSVTGTVLWLGLFVGVLTIVALWPVSILFGYLKVTLKTKKLGVKYAMFQMVLILSQLQTAIIYTLAMRGVIACSPPFSSRARGFILSQQLLILEMFIITLVNRFLYRHGHQDIPVTEEHAGEQADELVKSKVFLQPESKGDTCA
ncbi:organic solute transporter subunit alpha-like [Scleropages formosus]|uniref:Solute carrier family 51 member A n=1 Tax=Scleropages formosus TaxID=113540 RepID=A0A8D0CHC1_SCLFO|nr:organic solute transporter subunit alpha-like [Scleropages formosus]